MKKSHTNALIHSSSPYLLQHAHNPVNWHPWDDQLLKKAQQEDKLLLVSIGYAACHWCHVMEHESFEDEEVAGVMNEHFVCIKVDREERPDVDHYYMSAVHLMGQQGGWPLNVIALPDGRPVWGGTYFPKETWVKNILAVANFRRENRAKTNEYAESLQQGITRVSLLAPVENVYAVSAPLIERAVNGWKDHFDNENGGRNGYPKFPMPVNTDFLMHYGFSKNDRKVLAFVKLTFEKMARGGIYDQIGGGFARYSVDEKWKVPHFEKMLYDNGQLLSLYSKGYQLFKSDEFKTVVYETADFILRELADDSSAFWSALDADSEGEEGKFYVWKKGELEELLKDDFALFSKYFNVNPRGFWEKGNYILLRNGSDEDFTRENNLELSELKKKVHHWKKLLLKERNKRHRPGLDDKTLASWNALAIQGLTDAFKAFNDDRFLKPALENGRFIKKQMMKPDGRLFHTWKKGKSRVNGFLEDYALVIQAFVSLFEVTGGVDWLDAATQLLNYSHTRFYDPDSGLFYFSERDADQVVTNHFQNEDNVIPAANSVMANNLHKLSLILGDPQYMTQAKKMLQHITPLFPKYPQAYANWGNAMLKMAKPSFEVVVCGSEAETKIRKMQTDFRPNVLWAFSTGKSNVPVLKDRFAAGKTWIYVCHEGTCQLPVEDVEDALKLIS